MNSKGKTTGIDSDIAAFLAYVDGKAEGKFEVALCMLKRQFDYQTIAELTQLSMDAIENLAKKNRLICSIQSSKRNFQGVVIN